MANSVFPFEFGKKFVGFLLTDLVGGFAAVGGDEVELLGVFFEQLWNVGAAALSEDPENGDLGFVALFGSGAA